jgi:protein O-GlcNAc transferase
MNINNAIKSAFENYQRGNLQQAEDTCKEIIKVQSNNINAINLLGIIYYQLKNYDRAIQYMKDVIKLDPNSAQAYYIIGHSMQEKKQLDEAITYYQKALQYSPNLTDAYYNLGTVFQDKKRNDEAISCYQKALQFNPRDTDAYYNLGRVFQEIKLFNEAVSCYQKALELNPNLDDAYSNLATVLVEMNKHDEAIACCRKALAINPDLAEAYDLLAHEMQQMCNWQEFEALASKLDGLTRKALDTGTKTGETPFMSISRNADPSINFAIAKSWSYDIERAMSALKIHFPSYVGKKGKTKIVIGYLSDDFRDHPVAHLMLSLFGLHSRDNFEIFCYSYGKDDGSYYRARIQHDCDKFVDMAALGCEAAARCIHEDGVDILVDLKGYTRGSRLEICAFRPAPIQISYLGFPGSTGADFIDYIITDKIVTPKAYSPYYSEKFVYMPNCYQINDNTQPISNKKFRKIDFGLPESCFVFCSFNQPHKIDPVMFDSWMRILQRVPESVLWLPLGIKTVEENLKREAEARGVVSERLIFADRLPKKDEHLARLKFADLAFDTRIYNGHTTTSDALWAGVPVITLQGHHFASRVSSSILSALGVPELITYSIEEYETLAVRLALNALELKEIRQRIAQNRMVETLFDTPRFVRNLETAYKEMWKIFLAGDVPREIEVLES